jgi:N,N'-diacetyllegionaminate synthase
LSAPSRQPGSTAAELTVGAHRIGGGSRCFFIAEAGVNHNGEMGLAHQLVDVAAEARADAVKFQTFEPIKLASPEAGQAEYQIANGGRRTSQLEMLKKLTLSRAAQRELCDHARERGIIFLSTPFDEASADFLEELDVPAFKVGSGDLTNHPLLAHLARKGTPLLVSTGMSNLDEVSEAVDVILANGSPGFALLHCVTNYPTKPEECNLKAMATIRSAFGVPTGWSDHTKGIHLSLAAVALGAELLEKHFTLDRGLSGPDHRASLEPDELATLVRQVRDVEVSLGSGSKEPVSSERELAQLVRRSLHAARDLGAGHRLEASDVVSLRPGGGIPPTALSQLIGRRLKRPLEQGARLREEDFV